jgi:hypothetical protein
MITIDMPWEMPMNIRDVMRDRADTNGLVATISVIANVSRILTVKPEWPEDEPPRQIPLAMPPGEDEILSDIRREYRQSRVVRMNKLWKRRSRPRIRDNTDEYPCP